MDALRDWGHEGVPDDMSSVVWDGKKSWPVGGMRRPPKRVKNALLDLCDRAAEAQAYDKKMKQEKHDSKWEALGKRYGNIMQHINSMEPTP